MSVSWRRVSFAHGNKKFTRDFPRIPASIAKVNFISNKSTYVIPLKGDKWQQWQHLRDFLDCQLRACSHDVRPSLSMQPKACLGTIRTIQTQRRHCCQRRSCPSARCYKLTALVKLFRFWFCRFETPTLSAHEPSGKKETQNLCDFVKASQSNLRKIHYIVPIQSQVEPRVPYGCSSS